MPKAGNKQRDYIEDGQYTGKHRWQHDSQLHPTRGNRGEGIDPKHSPAGIKQPTLISSSFCSICGAWKGQLGLEPTPEMYIDHIVEICQEIRRVLRKDGVFFLNIGDSYVSNPGNRTKVGGFQANPSQARAEAESPMAMNKRGGLVQSYGEWTGQKARNGDGEFKKRGMSRIGIRHHILKSKDLCLIPFRLAIALQEDGWWVRSVIIWSKPNPMPESVSDRPSESHEYILMLTKSARYYFDQEAVREPYQPDSLRRTKVNVHNPKGMDRQGIDAWLDRIPKVRGYKTKRAGRGSNNPELGNRNFMPIQGEQFHGQDISSYPSGRNIRSVWEFPEEIIGQPENNSL